MKAQQQLTAAAGLVGARSSRVPGVFAGIWALVPWIEMAALVPAKAYTALFWLVGPLLLVVFCPVILLGGLLLLQAPIFFLLWHVSGQGRRKPARPTD